MAKNDNTVNKIAADIDIKIDRIEKKATSFGEAIEKMDKSIKDFLPSVEKAGDHINRMFNQVNAMSNKQARSFQSHLQKMELAEKESLAKRTMLENNFNVMQTTLLYKFFREEERAQEAHYKKMEVMDRRMSARMAHNRKTFLDNMTHQGETWGAGFALFGTGTAVYDAVSTISTVEMGMVSIMRVMEDATADMATMRAELFALGKEFGQPWEVVQDIALRWAQAGYNMADTMELTRDALLALNTAELNSEQATQGMIAIMSQWNLTAKELLPTLDKINKVADDYAISSQEIIDGLVRSSGAAKVMNLTLEQTIGILTAMREASGRTGKEVGNALNSILSFMQRPKSIEAFEKAGIQVFADAAKTTYRNATEIFADLSSKWNAIGEDVQESFLQSAEAAGLYADELSILTDAEKNELAAAGGNLYRRNYFIALLERWGVVAKAVATQEMSLGYSMQENARTMETLEKKWQSLQTAVQELYVTAGEAGLLDVLKGLVDGAKWAIDTFQKMPDPVKDVIIVMAELAIVIASVNFAMRVLGAGHIANGMIGLAANVGKVEKATVGLTGAIRVLATSSVGIFAGVATAVLGVVVAIDQLEEAQIREAKQQREQQKNLAELADRYKTLKPQVEKSAQAEAEMKLVIDQILKIKPELLESYDLETKKAKILEEQLYKTADAYKKSVEQSKNLERMGNLAQYKPQIDKLLAEKTAIFNTMKPTTDGIVNVRPFSDPETQRRLKEIDDEIKRLNTEWFKADGLTDEEIEELGNKAKGINPKDNNPNKNNKPVSSNAYNPWENARITSRFGENRGSYVHKGLDLAMKQGTELEAVGDGVITAKGKDSKGNAFVTIRLASGEEVTYVHLSKLPDAKVGTQVKAGDIIGLSGGKPGSWGAGNSKGEHLDFRIKVNGQYIDPEEWLKKASSDKFKEAGYKFDYTGYENEDDYEKQAKKFIDRYRDRAKGYENSLEAANATVKATQAELEQLKVREQLYQKTQQYDLLQRNLTQQVAVYTRNQQELHTLNNKNRATLAQVNLDMAELTNQYKSGKISTDTYSQSLQHLADLKNKLTVDIQRNSAAWWENQSALVDTGRAYDQVTQERVAKLRERIRQEADMGKLSLEQQIEYLSQLKKVYQLTADEMWEIDQDIVKARAKLLEQSFKEVEKSYKKMLDKIDKEAKDKIKDLEGQIDKLDKEEKTDDRADAEQEYNKQLTELAEERRYHELRTGKEHKDAIKEIDEKIAEEKRRWQEQQEDWAREDKKENLEKQIDDVKEKADEERRQLEEHYQRVKDVAESGILDTIAAIAATNPQWFETGKTLIDQLIQGLKTGDFSGVQQIIDSVTEENRNQTGGGGGGGGGPSDNTIEDEIDAITNKPIATISKGQYELQGSTALMRSRELAAILGQSVDWDDKTQEVIMGGRRFKPRKLQNGTSWVGIREVAEALGYGIKWDEDAWSIDILPKAHTGASVAREGVALLRSDERVLSPIMTNKFEELNTILSKIPSLKGLGGTTVQLNGPLFNSEKTVLEGDLDVDTTGRQLWKSAKSIGRARGK